MRITAISTLFAISVLVLAACRDDKSGDDIDDKTNDARTTVGEAERKDDKHLGTARETQQGTQPGVNQQGRVPNEQTMNQPIGREQPGSETVQMSEEMRVLVDRLGQGEDAAVAVLEQYGASKELGNELGAARLSSHRVVARDGDCYTLEAMEGALTRVYMICWSGGKIDKIERQPDKQQRPGT